MPEELAIRYETYLEQVYLMTKTFASLQLDGRAAICDSLLAMVTTFADVEGAVLLTNRAGDGITLGALRGEAVTAELTTAVAQHFRDVIDGGGTHHLGPEHVARLVPGLAARIPALAVAALYAGEVPLGLLLIEHRATTTDAAVLAFLSAAAGICSLAITNADALADARALALSLEDTAHAAKREAAEKSKLLVATSEQLATIHEQQQQLDALAFPLLTVSKRIIVAPLIGKVDAERGDALAKRILTGIATSHAEILIIDVTGALIVGASSADRLLDVVNSVKLFGIVVAITGMQPALASTLGEEGLRNLKGVETFATLENGLRRFSSTSRG